MRKRLLEFRNGFRSFMRGEIAQTADVDRIQGSI
jgi:hypothetical protein